jgi:Asp/Glu/hydantoin racemase
MTTDQPLIALVSAVTAAINPAAAAMTDALPKARIWNILDDRLLQDADEAGGVTPELADRMTRLIEHARHEGADGVLLTCSMYGPVAERLAVNAALPLFAPDQAAFAAVVAGEYTDVLVLSSGAGPLVDSVDRLRAVLADADSTTTVSGAVAPDAAAAARAGDIAALTAALRQAVESAAATPDAILLGQYSISPAATALEEALHIPVIAGPQRAAAAMRQALESGGPA